MGVRIINADVLDGLRGLPDESVHACVTSPPYFGLRSYLRNDDPNKPLEIGLEPTLHEHLTKLVEVFREVRRVLRSDGTLWLNYGDGFCQSDKWGGGTNGNAGKQTVAGDGSVPSWAIRQKKPKQDGLKPKDLLMMPARLAIALQADGWWIRSDIIWHKTAPMPESVRDRPTKSHEHIFMLTKSPRYFFDAEAVREVAITDASSRHWTERDYDQSFLGVKQANGVKGRPSGVAGYIAPGARNIRDVWTLNTEPFDGEFCTACGRYYDGAEKRQIKVDKDKRRFCKCGRHDAWLSHFATFPSELVEKCILAGTSEKGCCAECGAPWVRETAVSYDNPGNRTTNGGRSLANREITAGFAQRLEKRTETTGWGPSCTCNADVVPCTVIDPFFGSGTTGLVADRLQRDCIGIELNADYAAMAEKRISREAGMFAQITTETPHTPAEAAE